MMKNKKKSNKSVFATEDFSKTLHKNLEFTATEQYKLLRANLSFTLHEEQKCPVIGVTSSMRGEGKSTTALNLSYVLALDGKKVLLIDGDLRIPSVAKKMELESSPGLTDMLLHYETISLDGFKTDVLDNWYILPSGEIPPNPSELLGSRKMEKLLNYLSDHFDYIVVDLPPVNLVSDALAVSKFIAGMIVFIREDYTEKRELDHCLRQLKLSNVNVLGCVLNESKFGKGSYGKYKYRNKYRYSKYYKYSSYSEYKKHD